MGIVFSTMGWIRLSIGLLLATFSDAKPSEQVSLLSETPVDVTSTGAPAYWSAQCGDRTYVGSYTLMMEWNDCKDYCRYFPHAGELGHTFQFADILDQDIMECLRYNMNAQYTPGNGYAGHYWAGGRKVSDGVYVWDSGEKFEFDDFVGSPGNDPYIHLTPGNNYAWNLKSDKNDRNNGCLCKSEQPSSEIVKTTSGCREGWTDTGSKCVYIVWDGKRWEDAFDRCHQLGGELVSWNDRGEFMGIKFFLLEQCQVINPGCKANWFWTGGKCDNEEQIYLWNDSSDPVPMDFGWAPWEPAACSAALLYPGASPWLQTGGLGAGYFPICQWNGTN